MALYKIDIEKSMEGEFWTNRYLVNESDLSGAALHVATLVQAEQVFHGTAVLFTKARVSDMQPDSDTYTTLPLNLSGGQADEGVFIPLFNVVRVDLGVLVGRPSRKFYRGVLRESHISFNTVYAPLAVLIQTTLMSMIQSVPVCDPDLQLIQSVAVSPNVGMRQLRRGSRRRATPVIP